MAAGPLLVASLSTSPVAVGAAVAVQQLPWLLFALVSGAVVDRVDRRRLILAANSGRSVILAGLAALVAFDALSLPVLYAALFLLGAGETLADNATGALVVRLVPREQLGAANARLSTVFTVGNQFAGPPLGAWLFALAAAAPFGLHAIAFAGSALLIASLAVPGVDRAESPEPATQPLRQQITMGCSGSGGIPDCGLSRCASRS